MHSVINIAACDQVHLFQVNVSFVNSRMEKFHRLLFRFCSGDDNESLCADFGKHLEHGCSRAFGQVDKEVEFVQVAARKEVIDQSFQNRLTEG